MLKFNILNKPGFARLLAFLSLCLLISCSQPHPSIAPKFLASEWSPGGLTTVSPTKHIRFDLPAANLPHSLKTTFHAGKALAHQPWVKAPTITTSRDGLGPLYNARTCLACHVNGGKGAMPRDSKTALFSSLVRLSKTGINKMQGVIPHPIYGDQLQTQSTSLAHQLRHIPSAQSMAKDVAPETYIYIKWNQKIFTYPDQHQVVLTSPELDLRNLNYGPIGNDTLFSIRVAPSIHGMGLIDLIPQAQINALADEFDTDKNGISGRVNHVWDVEKQTSMPGRFGLKANKPTLAMTVAGAFANDLGISNPLFPDQPCTQTQIKCKQAANGNDKNGFELTQQQLDLVVNFNRDLAPVKARNLTDTGIQNGRELFYKSGCQNCHNPKFTTQENKVTAHLSQQTIWPYSDFLLHDLGKGLADNRPDFEANGQEWRTAPLWGVGLGEKVNGSKALLHDGRAQTIEEAILWHDGEAKKSKNMFIQLNKDERNNVINFVNAI